MKKGESVENLKSNLVECCKLVNVPRNYCHFHQIGPSHVDENTDKILTVKCNSWQFRKEFYNARPLNFENSKKKPGNRSLQFHWV